MEKELEKELKGRWCSTNGSRINCNEKLMVMEENLKEIKTLLQDAIDDAVLMGCSEESFRRVYEEVIRNLRSQYPEQKDLPGEKS